MIFIFGQTWVLVVLLSLWNVPLRQPKVAIFEICDVYFINNGLAVDSANTAVDSGIQP